jgi:hypothetical protein
MQMKKKRMMSDELKKENADKMQNAEKEKHEPRGS